MLCDMSMLSACMGSHQLPGFESCPDKDEQQAGYAGAVLNDWHSNKAEWKGNLPLPF